MNNYASTSSNPFTRQTPSFISGSSTINSMNYYSNGYTLNTNTTGPSNFNERYFNSTSSRVNDNVFEIKKYGNLGASNAGYNNNEYEYKSSYNMISYKNNV